MDTPNLNAPQPRMHCVTWQRWRFFLTLSYAGRALRCQKSSAQAHRFADRSFYVSLRLVGFEFFAGRAPA